MKSYEKIYNLLREALSPPASKYLAHHRADSNPGVATGGRSMEPDDAAATYAKIPVKQSRQDARKAAFVKNRIAMYKGGRGEENTVAGRRRSQSRYRQGTDAGSGENRNITQDT